MAKFKSPGQKRKGIVRLVCIGLFLIVTFVGASMLAKFTDSSLAWVKNHQVATATVAKLDHEIEEHRSLKGRKRSKDVYYASYEFSVGEEKYLNKVKVGEALYERLSAASEKSVTVWYASDAPATNNIRENIEAESNNNNLMSNIIVMLPSTVPGAIILYWILGLIFVRESKDAMPQGFFTESSWLDVDDRQVVALDGAELINFSYSEKRADAVQDAYQNNAPLGDIIAVSQATSVVRIPLSEVQELESSHNSDVISVKHNGKAHKIEFLNRAVKNHALERIQQHLPEGMKYSKEKKTRLRAVLPAIVFIAILLGVGYVFEHVLVHVIVGFIVIVKIIPSMISLLIDPTVTEQWLLEAGAIPLGEASS